MRRLKNSQRIVFVVLYALGSLALLVLTDVVNVQLGNQPAFRAELVNIICVTIGGGVTGLIAFGVEVRTRRKYGRWPQKSWAFIIRLMLISIVWVDLGVTLGVLIRMALLILPDLTGSISFAFQMPGWLGLFFVLVILPAVPVGAIIGVIGGSFLVRLTSSERSSQANNVFADHVSG